MSKQTVYIIKVGGNILDDNTKLSSFLRQFAQLPGLKLLVHGGGKIATTLARDLSIPQQMVEGRRVTDIETLKIVTMVYAGLINKTVVAQLQSMQCKAIGMCGADADAIQAHKRTHPEIDYGYVGDVDSVNTTSIIQLLNLGLNIVMAPITHDGKGQLLNTNADTIAQELAKALSIYYNTALIYSFEKDGVLLDVDDNSSVIRILNKEYFSTLKTEGRIHAGMIPKLDNAFKALDAGVGRVIIGPAETLTELVDGTAGTSIVH